MCNGNELETLQKKSFLFGQLALTGSWILFVLALAAAAWLPASVLSSSTVLTGYALAMTIIWAFYIITVLGCCFMQKFPGRKILQYTGLLLLTASGGCLLFHGAVFFPLLIIAVTLALQTRYCCKCVFLNIFAALGEFLGIANSVLLYLLLKALLIGEWDFAGLPLRCSILLSAGGIISIVAVIARGKLLSGGKWDLRHELGRKSVIVMWSLLVLSVIAALITEPLQHKKLLNVKAEAEKTFQYELSAAGMEKFYLDGKTADPEFYRQLEAVNRQIFQKMRSPELRKLFRKKQPLTAEQKQLLTDTQKQLSGEYAALDKLLSVPDIPKYPVKFQDGSLSQLPLTHIRILRSASFNVLQMLSNQSGEHALKHSQNFFKLLNSMDNFTLASVAAQRKLVERWSMTVKKLYKDKKITAVQFQ